MVFLRVRFWAPFSSLYINDPPHAISDLSTPILFADDTSLIISNPDNQKFVQTVNETIHSLKTWFHSNLLVLNLEKNALSSISN